MARLTKDIIETYQKCNPKFKYSEELNPKWFLTSPSVGVLNDGHDNVNSDLILTVNFVLINLETQRRFDTAFYNFPHDFELFSESFHDIFLYELTLHGQLRFVNGQGQFSFPLAQFNVFGY